MKNATVRLPAQIRSATSGVAVALSVGLKTLRGVAAGNLGGGRGGRRRLGAASLAAAFIPSSVKPSQGLEQEGADKRRQAREKFSDRNQGPARPAIPGFQTTSASATEIERRSPASEVQDTRPETPKFKP